MKQRFKHKRIVELEKVKEPLEDTEFFYNIKEDSIIIAYAFAGDYTELDFPLDVLAGIISRAKRIRTKNTKTYISH